MARSLGTLTIDLVLQLAGFKQGMDRAARETERGAKRIQQNIAGLQRSFATAGRVLGAFGVGFGVSSIISGLSDATKEAIEFGDEIGKAMAKTGIGAEALTELAFAAKQDEIALDSLTTALKRMQVTLSEAGSGSKAANETLTALGLTIQQLKALAPEEQFELLADRIAALKDPADRTRAAVDLFGRSGADLLPLFEKGARGIREAREAAHDFNATLTEEQVAALQRADKALDELSASYDGLKRSIGGVIAEPLTAFFEGVTEAIRNANDETLTFRDRAGLIVEAYKKAFADKGILAGPQDLAEAYKQLAEEAEKAAKATKAVGALPPGGRNRQPFAPGFQPEEPKPKGGTDPAEQARKAIDDLIVSLKQQSAVTGETEEATIRYRIAFGDLVDDFKKAGPAFEERKQQLIDAAAAADQFKAGEELQKANEAIAQQVIDLQAARIALDDGAAAAFRYSAQHGELAEKLDLATDSQAEFNDRVEEGANAVANVELQQAITTFDDLIRSTEEATTAIIANKIAEEQGAVAAIRYRIAQGDLSDEAKRLGISLGELQTRLESAVAAQEAITQAEAEQAASESIIPSRTKALKEYDDAIAGLERRLASGDIEQRQFAAGVKIAEKNFKEATKAIDEMSIFAEEAARNMQSAFADFLFDPFEKGLDGMLEGFAETLRRMAAEVVAAQLAEKFNLEDLFKGGGIFGGGGGGIFGGGGGGATGLSEIAITAQKIPLPGAAAAVGGVAGESAAAAAFTAAGTAAATALTAAGTSAAAAFTGAGTAAATALTASGSTVAASIIAAGTTAAAAIGAAATAGSAAGGLSEIIITAARLAEGGKVRGPGTAKSDSVPAMLSAGEFVVKAEAVRKPGVERLLTEINNQTVNQSTVHRYAAGGRVDVRTPATPAHEWHRTFDAQTQRTALADIKRTRLDERRLTVERLLHETAAPIVVDLRRHTLRDPDELERLLARLGMLHRAEGGKVFGPGTATSDSIPAWLSAGEFVVKAAAVKQPGIQELLERINARGGVFNSYASGGYVYSPHTWTKHEQHFASGGLVQVSATPTANPAPTIVQQTFNFPNVTNVSRSTEGQITAAAARGARMWDRHNN